MKKSHFILGFILSATIAFAADNNNEPASEAVSKDPGRLYFIKQLMYNEKVQTAYKELSCYGVVVDIVYQIVSSEKYIGGNTTRFFLTAYNKPPFALGFTKLIKTAELTIDITEIIFASSGGRDYIGVEWDVGNIIKIDNNAKKT